MFPEGGDKGFAALYALEPGSGMIHPCPRKPVAGRGIVTSFVKDQ